MKGTQQDGQSGEVSFDKGGGTGRRGGLLCCFDSRARLANRIIGTATRQTAPQLWPTEGGTLSPFGESTTSIAFAPARTPRCHFSAELSGHAGRVLVRYRRGARSAHARSASMTTHCPFSHTTSRLAGQVDKRQRAN